MIDKDGTEIALAVDATRLELFESRFGCAREKHKKDQIMKLSLDPWPSW